MVLEGVGSSPAGVNSKIQKSIKSANEQINEFDKIEKENPVLVGARYYKFENHLDS